MKATFEFFEANEESIQESIDFHSRYASSLPKPLQFTWIGPNHGVTFSEYDFYYFKATKEQIRNSPLYKALK